MKLSRLPLLVGLALFVGAPAAAQAVTATLPVTCRADGTQCVPATPVVNPDGTNIGDGSGGGTPTGSAGSPNANVVTVQGIAGGVAQPVSATALPLPTGAAQDSTVSTVNATLGTTNTTLTAINTKFPTSLGAKGGSGSLSVVPNTDTPFPTLNTPTATATYGLTSVTVAAVTSNVLKNSAGNVYSLNLVNGSVAGFVVLYDATAAPTSGTALTTGLIRYCFPMAASAGFDKVFQVPMAMTNGAVLLASTSCTTYTALGTAPVLMTGQVK